MPELTDGQILSSLLDTWDAVDDGLYAGYPDESGKQFHLRVGDWNLRIMLTQEDGHAE